MRRQSGTLSGTHSARDRKAMAGPRACGIAALPCLPHPLPPRRVAVDLLVGFDKDWTSAEGFPVVNGLFKTWLEGLFRCRGGGLRWDAAGCWCPLFGAVQRVTPGCSCTRLRPAALPFTPSRAPAQLPRPHPRHGFREGHAGAGGPAAAHRRLARPAGAAPGRSGGGQRGGRAGGAAGADGADGPAAQQPGRAGPGPHQVRCPWCACRCGRLGPMHSAGFPPQPAGRVVWNEGMVPLPLLAA